MNKLNYLVDETKFARRLEFWSPAESSLLLFGCGVGGIGGNGMGGGWMWRVGDGSVPWIWEEHAN
jgi:hypothetical protein